MNNNIDTNDTIAKIDYNNITIEQLVNIINDNLSNYNSLKALTEDIFNNVDVNTIRKRLSRNNYKLNKDINKYMLEKKVNKVSKVSKVVSEEPKVKNNNGLLNKRYAKTLQLIEVNKTIQKNFKIDVDINNALNNLLEEHKNVEMSLIINTALYEYLNNLYK